MPKTRSQFLSPGQPTDEGTGLQKVNVLFSIFLFSLFFHCAHMYLCSGQQESAENTTSWLTFSPLA
jgi:hypothetical protein